jgi:RNA polymerase sigma-70 factor, ECF subfamily
MEIVIKVKMIDATRVMPDPVAEPTSIDLEQQWIQSARQGDLDAFNKLILMHQDSLYNWVSYLVHDPDLAEDVTQTVFITAYEKMKSFRNGSFRSWLFQIAKNRSIDLYRSNQRHPTISLNDPISAEDEQDRIEWIQDGTLSPVEQVEAQERANMIQNLLQRLPEEYRTVLVLIDIHEMNYEEAAQALNVPLGTIKSRLVRGRLKLRDLLAKSGMF